MKHEEAVKWLKMQSNKPVKWDDYSEENKQIREEAERRMKEAFNMAIEALKAQGPVEPSWRRGIPFCGKCGRQFGRGFKYCPDCGRAVKWE